MVMRHSLGVAFVVAATSIISAQAPQPVTLLSEVRAAIAAHDLARAGALVSRHRADKGNTPEVLEAQSWLARGAQSEGQPDRAEAIAADVHKQAVAKLAGRPVDSDAQLAAAISNAIEVQAQVAAARGERSESIAFLDRELSTYRNTSLSKRIQKNINLLTLEGHPAPALETSEWVGAARTTLGDVKGKVVVLFFWAHWCPDCKIQGLILAKLRERYQSKGLAIVAPTQRYGYVARGAAAPPDEELRYIVKIRDEFYPFLADLPVPLSVANHQRYGVSSTPTVVILDRQGMVRVYHPGRMTEPELDLQLRSLLDSH